MTIAVTTLVLTPFVPLLLLGVSIGKAFIISTIITIIIIITILITITITITITLCPFPSAVGPQVHHADRVVVLSSAECLGHHRIYVHICIYIYIYIYI